MRKNKSYKDVKKSHISSGFIHSTAECVWIILLSIVGNFIFKLEINLSWSFDCIKFRQFVLLFVSVILYGFLYYRIRKSYEIAQEKHRDSYVDWKSGKREQVLDGDELFRNHLRSEKYRILKLILIVFSVALLLAWYLYLNSVI